MANSGLTVFVSSTSEDLREYRKVAEQVILDMQWHPSMQEHFDNDPGITPQSCFKLIDQSDVMLLIVAWRQGWVPTVEQGGNGLDSITALEVEHARKKSIPILVLLANKSWPGDLYEDADAKRQWMRTFRESVNQLALFFDYEPPVAGARHSLPGFRLIVERTLLAHKKRVLAELEPAAGGLEYVGSARTALMRGKLVPIIGCGIFRDSPLCPVNIGQALIQRKPSTTDHAEPMSLATAAEYRERHEVSRNEFLNEFRSILDRARAGIVRPALFDMLAGIENLPLIVSVTHDNLLEEAFKDRAFVTVSHVLRSRKDDRDGEYDGQLLLSRPGQRAKFVAPDKFTLPPDECVIYKPLGSPYLHDDVGPDEEVDTVVITERDHGLFLQRLDSQDRGLPNCLRSKFKRSPLLFLGYSMDAWQYRLMMLLFQYAGRQGQQVETLAVRKPDSEMEEVAWGALNAKLMRIDAEEFATQAKGAAG